MRSAARTNRRTFEYVTNEHKIQLGNVSVGMKKTLPNFDSEGAPPIPVAKPTVQRDRYHQKNVGNGQSEGHRQSLGCLGH